MALGATLKEARMRKKLTASEIAQGTRMKVQTVTALEEEDFEKIAAPIYAKGFIKLYAEFVGLDPQALTDEYVARFVESGKRPPSPGADQQVPVAATPSPQPSADEPPTPAPAAVPGAPKAASSDAPGPTGDPDDALMYDGELDLFAEVNAKASERRGILMDDGYREEEPSLRDRISDLLSGGVDALQDAVDAAGGGCRRFCSAVGDFVVRAWTGLGVAVKARRNELSQIDFKRLSARHMMALIGVLVLVLLVVSSLSRCVRSGDTAAPTEAMFPVPDAAEPGDVYLD